MTEKRFTLENGNLSNVRCNILDYGYGYTNKGLCDLLNELHEENQYLKQSNKDARCILKREFDFATEQRQKHLDDAVLTNAYDIIRFDMRKALDKLGWLE